MSFEIGDVVMLKSGGPALTVAEVSANGVTCMWYAETEDNFRSALIPADCLLAFDDSDDEIEDEDEDDDSDD